VTLMQRLATFCGISVLTYAVMANHFHLLCEVPAPRALSDEELLVRLEALYGDGHRRAARDILSGQSPGGPTAAQALREACLARMFDISVFLKELKGRFAQAYNRRHARYGALWAERFKSVLVEGGRALTAVALYIDLNPVRAGLCDDPKDYQYCGYGEALASGKRTLCHGLARALGYEPGEAGWAEVSAEYRRLLFRCGVTSSKAGDAVLDMDQARRVVEDERGALPLMLRLGARLRDLTYGLVFGGRRFVEEHRHRCRRDEPQCSLEPDNKRMSEAAGLFVWRRGRAAPMVDTS